MALKETKEKVGSPTPWNGRAVRKHISLLLRCRKREERAEAWEARENGERTPRFPRPRLCARPEPRTSCSGYQPTCRSLKSAVRVPPAGQRPQPRWVKSLSGVTRRCPRWEENSGLPALVAFPLSRPGNVSAESIWRHFSAWAENIALECPVPGRMWDSGQNSGVGEGRDNQGEAPFT